MKKLLTLLMFFLVATFAANAETFSQTFSYATGNPTGWSLTNFKDNSGYYLVPTDYDPSVATIPGIFTGKTITSDVRITLNVATYDNGDNPNSSTFSIYNSSDCMTAVPATQSGTLPTSKTYTNVIYTVSLANAIDFTNDIAIKITKPGKQIRLKSITIEFSYDNGQTGTHTYTVTLSDGGALTQSTSGASVTLPSRDNVGNWTFSGWSKTDNGSVETTTKPTIIPAGAYIPTGNITLYPVYTRTEGTNHTSSVSIEKYAADNEWQSSGVTPYTTIVLDDNISVSTTGTGNNGKYYSEWRLYQNGNGNMIITANNGYTLNSATITFTTSSGGVLLYNGSNVTSGTPVDVSSNPAEFIVRNSGAATNGQVRVTAISVNYGSGASYYITTPTTTKTQTTLTFGDDVKDGVTKQVGDAPYASAATLAPAVDGATITYGSTNVNVATIDNGTVTIVGVGTTTISAAYAGNDDYEASQASYTLNVEAAPTYTINWSVNGTIVSTETLVEGANVNPPTVDPLYGKVFTGWVTTETVDATTTPIYVTPSTATENTTYYAVFATQTSAGESSATNDVLNNNIIGASSSDLGWSGKKLSSGAIYAGNTEGTYNSIGLRSYGNTSGIISTTSGGKATKVVVTWNTNSTNGRKLNIYGSNTKYSSPADLYDPDKQGKPLGQITYGTSTELTIEGDYKYIGIRSAASALYLDKVTITWVKESPATYTDYTTQPQAPAKVLTGIAVTGTPEEFWKGDSFNHNGITIMATYEGDDTPVDVTEACSFTGYDMSAAGEQTVTVSYTEGEVTKNAEYTINVNEIPVKTIADFISSGGGKCYLIGIVSDIKNTTYGNYTLTDDCGSIYIYGTLTPSGEKQKFNTLDVVEGDKIKVLANSYEYYQNKTHEAKDVIFVEEIEIEKVKSVVTIETPQNGTIVVKNGETVINSGDEVEEGTVLTVTCTPDAGYRLKNWQVVDNTTHTFTVATTYTMEQEPVTIKANFELIPTYTISWSVNGTIVKTEQVNEGTPVTAPEVDSPINGKVFTGNWVTSPIIDPVNPAPTYVTPMNATADATYYAVFATQTGSGGTVWRKLEASQVTQEGTYALLTTDNHAFNGSISSGHGQTTTDAFTFVDGVASSAPAGTCELTFIASENGYKIYNSDKGYLYATKAASGGLAWNKESSYWYYSSSNWCYNVNEAYLRSYNNASFRTYGSNNGDVLQLAIKETNGTTYSDFTTFPTATPASKTLKSIAISDYTTEFTLGDEFTFGGKVMASYEEDGVADADVTSKATFSGYDMNTVGTQTVTVSYTEGEITKNATYDITVNAPVTLTGIAIDGTPSKTSYHVGDAFSTAGLSVIATYSDNSTEGITEGIEWTVDPETFTETGDEIPVSVTATYEGMDATETYNVTVTEAPANVLLDFTKINGFDSWSNSYANHVVEYDCGTVTFANANKQSSTITNMPVTKGDEVTFVAADGKTITSLELTCKQWDDKNQTITLYTSTDGGKTYTETNITSANFVLTTNNLPVGVNAVKFTFSSSNNQIGIQSLNLTFGNAGQTLTLKELVTKGNAGETDTETTYTIGNELQVVEYIESQNILLVKDDNGQAVNPVKPAESDKNYVIHATSDFNGNGDMRNEKAQTDYDQSNWLEVVIPATVDGNDFVGKIIKAGTIKGSYTDTMNPRLVLETKATLTAKEGAIESYYRNPMCAANFAGSQDGYFFMTPKPNELVQVVWAVYDNGYFYMPDANSGNSYGFAGKIASGNLTYNDTKEPGLQNGYAYQFKAIVKKAAQSSAAPRKVMTDKTFGHQSCDDESDGFTLYPINLAHNENIVTGVDGVNSSKAVESVKFFNLQGAEFGEMQPGVNIMVIKFTDGTTLSSKVIK